MTSFAKRDAVFSKFDDEHRIAYGWAIVSEENGKPYFDLQGDHIPMDAIITASVDFMKNSRVSDDMHDEKQTGEVVFCAPVMKGQLVDPDYPGRTGLWIGTQIHDDKVYEMTKSGKRAGFSIGGFLDEADYVTAGVSLKAKRDTIRRVDNDHLAKRERLDKGKKPQRIFRAFRLGFISTVDLPAQEGALISVVKGAGPEALLWLRKGVVLTSEDDGHQHVVDPSCFDEKGRGWTSSAQISAKDYGGYHSHDMVRDDDGSITIASNLGHGHTVDVKAVEAPKVDPESPAESVSISLRAPGVRNASTHKGLVRREESALGCANKDKELKMATIEIEQSKYDELVKTAEGGKLAVERAERAEKMAELTEAQRAYIGKLSGPGQTSFLAKSAIERDTELKAQVVYISPVTGDVYYKFEDARLVKNAQRADESEKRSIEDSALAKRAIHKASAEKFLKAYPGTEDVHVAAVEAIESIKDEPTRKSVFEIIAAGQTALLSKQSTTGMRGSIERQAGVGNAAGGDANASPIEKKRGELRVAVEEFQKANNIGQYELAFAQAIRTDAKVRDLYEQLSETN